MNPNIKNILELDFSEDKLIRNELLKLGDNLQDSSLMNFESPLILDIKKIYQHYYNKLSAYSNAFINRLNYYQKTAITIKNLDFSQKQKTIKDITKQINNRLSEINDKANYIKTKFDFIKQSIINLLNFDKNVLIGKVHCKSYMLNKINLINNLKSQFKNLEQVMQNLNEKKVEFNNKKLALINMNCIGDEKINKAFAFRNCMFQFFKDIKKDLSQKK